MVSSSDMILRKSTQLLLISLIFRSESAFLPYQMASMFSFDIFHHRAKPTRLNHTQPGHQATSAVIVETNPGDTDTIIAYDDTVSNDLQSNSVYHQRGQQSRCANCVCGVVNRKMRIVGGSLSEQNEFPWMAALSKKGNVFYCGATVITNRHLLTAAHCVDGMSPRQVRATVGEYNRAIKNDTRRILVKIKQIIRHEGFQITNFHNDIAILRTETEIPFDQPYIQPACLPSSGGRNYTGITGTVTGWGRTGETKPTSNKLLKVDIPIISNEDCQHNSGYSSMKITDNMMCAGNIDKGQKDSCQGDSGGPLQITGSQPHTMEVIGIVSWGRGCARPNFPGVYTRIANYIDWVDENVDEKCTCKR